ncbi:MAG TPA: isocitrate lyase/phosphoenolpyruvate mutase family protein [Thermoplasmata archaeon]|nr:isocitrate lyase/phosphoenolpyruvate mutase family protein [Thermoplasmata archaeon]
MLSLAERAERFRALHRAPRLFVLPNAWDVPSARVFEDAGFPAVATSSAGVMVSLGYPDGEEIPREVYVAAVRRIAAKLAVPLSADVVAGFGRTATEVADTVRAVVEAGAVGINLEDQDPATEALLPLPAQAEKIRAVRALGEELGVPLVINARTDALWRGGGAPEDRFREAVRRGRAFRDAGADCVYPMRLTDRAEIAAFVGEVPGPVNVMIRAGLPPLEELERLGVRRVSFGPGASYAALGLLKRIATEVLHERSFRSLIDGAITFDELNRLAEPRAPDLLREPDAGS